MVAFTVLCLAMALFGRWGLKISVRMDFLSKRRVTTHWYDTLFMMCMIFGIIGTVTGLVGISWNLLP
jgi:hypothetical protein